MQNERTFYVETLYYTAPNMFAGSVFELEEDTEYEVRFTLTDPDGVGGEAQRVVNVRTRAEPQPFAGGNTYHVYPFGYEGPKQEPAFTGLLAAYYKNALGGDWSRASPPRVQPGDTILVHAGEYKDFDRFSYSHEIRTQYGTCCGDAVGRHVLSDAGRHGRAADRDQGRRRRRSRSSTATATTCCSTSWAPTTRTSKASPSATRISPSKPARRASPAPRA